VIAISPLKKFLALSFKEKRLFLEALIFVYCAKIMLLLFPFKLIVKFISYNEYPSIHPEIEQLKQIKVAIARANRLAFWKNVCIVQSIAARWMLNRRKVPSKLSLGVIHDKNGKMIAHAWIKVNGFEIVSRGLEYKELVSFE